MTCFWIIIILCVAIAPLCESQCTLPRVRRSWRNLNRREQELYVEAVLLTKTRGIYDQFIEVHITEPQHSYSHGEAGFLPWHRFFIYIYEETLRSLGPKYQCITIPYWDWELDKDAGKGQASVIGDLFGNYMPGLDPDTGVCIRDGRFKDWRPLMPPGLQPEFNYLTRGCLVRSFNVGFRNRNFTFPSETEVAQKIAEIRNYAVMSPDRTPTNEGFVTFMDTTFHGAAHVYLGGHMAWPFSPNDPLFFLHHSQVDRIWALWQDCHDHDRVNVKDGIQNRSYYFYGPTSTGSEESVPDGPLDPMFFTFGNGRRDPRYYDRFLPRGQREFNAMDVMRIMDNRRIPNMAYAYDPADKVKGILDRMGVQCKWNWFTTPNSVIRTRQPAPPPPPAPAPAGPRAPAPARPPPAPARPPPAPARPPPAPEQRQPEQQCGNGILDQGEECDAPRRCAGCSNECRSLCGNGVVDCGEDCDDGNRVDGDGCPSNCRWARSWRRIRNDIRLEKKKREEQGEEGVLELDPDTAAYINGEMSWENYLFKRSAEQQQQQRPSVYSPVVQAPNGTERQLRLKNGLEGSPLSSYLIFGKIPDAPSQLSNPAVEKLASNVCEKNPLTKYANARAKLTMLSYIENEMSGCGFRASARWMKMMRLNLSLMQRPCKPAICCKVASISSDQMICDGGGSAEPICDEPTCTWKYDCSQANLDSNTTKRNSTGTKPRVYRTYGAQESNTVAYNNNDVDATGGASNGLSNSAKIGVGVGGVALVAIVVVVGFIMWKKRQPVVEKM